jgi:hypothetical protein
VIGTRHVLAIVSAALGVGLGSLAAAGCSLGGDCECAPPKPIREGTFGVTSVESSTMPDAVSSVRDATIMIGSDTVTVEYDRADAHVTATYRVVTKYPL